MRTSARSLPAEIVAALDPRVVEIETRREAARIIAAALSGATGRRAGGLYECLGRARWSRLVADLEARFGVRLEGRVVRSVTAAGLLDHLAASVNGEVRGDWGFAARGFRGGLAPSKSLEAEMVEPVALRTSPAATAYSHLDAAENHLADAMAFGLAVEAFSNSRELPRPEANALAVMADRLAAELAAIRTELEAARQIIHPMR